MIDWSDRKLLNLMEMINENNNYEEKFNKKWENSHLEDATIVLTKQKEIGILDFLRKTWRDVCMSEIKREWVINLISKRALLINYLRHLNLTKPN